MFDELILPSQCCSSTVCFDCTTTADTIRTIKYDNVRIVILFRIKLLV